MKKIILFLLLTHTIFGQQNFTFYKNGSINNLAGFLNASSIGDNSLTACLYLETDDAITLMPSITVLDSDGQAVIDSFYKDYINFVFLDFLATDQDIILAFESSQNNAIARWVTFAIDDKFHLTKISESSTFTNNEDDINILSSKTILNDGRFVFTKISGNADSINMVVIDQDGLILNQRNFSNNLYFNKSSVLPIGLDSIYLLNENIYVLNSSLEIVENRGLDSLQFNEYPTHLPIDKDNYLHYTPDNSTHLFLQLDKDLSLLDFYSIEADGLIKACPFNSVIINEETIAIGYVVETLEGDLLKVTQLTRDYTQMWTRTIQLKDDDIEIQTFSLNVADDGSLMICGSYEDDILPREIAFVATIQNINTNINTENALLSSISIYPNPASEFVTIKMDNYDSTDESLTVYSSSGQIVLNQAIAQNETTITASNWPKGIYYFNIKNDQTSFTKQILIK